MLKYSGEALRLKPRFYTPYNSMDVYVEDEDDEVFYEKLLAKVLARSMRVGRVFGVGGKTNLFSMIEEYLSKPSARERFFIADADFDRLLGRSFPKTGRLHVLAEYCIENFLFEDAAIYSLMQEELPTKTVRELEAAFDVGRWLEDCIHNLTPLFACFIIIQKHGLGVENVKVGIGPFITDRGIPQLDKKKVSDYVDTMRNTFPVVGKTKFDEEMSLVVRRMGKTWRSRKRYICGKHYLLPLLRFEVKRHTRKDTNAKSFRFRIMKNCDLSSLHPLKKQMEEIAFPSGDQGVSAQG